MILVSSFVAGLVFGSFLNVVIDRLKNGRNVVFGRSFCPKCKTQLKWYDLIPIGSFIYLFGRCRYCREKISWQYPLVEILSGLIWISVFYKVFGLEFGIWDLFRISDFEFRIFEYIYYIFVLSALLIIAVYDFKWRIIPDKIIYPAVFIALIYNTSSAFKLLNFEIFIIPILTAAAAFLFFFLIYFFSRGSAMGLGDAKLALLIGLFLKPFLAIVAFTLAFIVGAAFGIILIGLGKKTLKSQIALGPFLILGTIITFFLSDFFNNFISFL